MGLTVVDGATSHMMADVCGGTSRKVYDATSRMMIEVGGASCTMKVCGATESILINIVNLIISVVIDMRQYISRRKILH